MSENKQVVRKLRTTTNDSTTHSTNYAELIVAGCSANDWITCRNSARQTMDEVVRRGE
jgi:hypothetical protein